MLFNLRRRRQVSRSKNITQQYCELFENINLRSIDSNISVKPTHIGLDISKNVVLENFNKIIEVARVHARNVE